MPVSPRPIASPKTAACRVVCSSAFLDSLGPPEVASSGEVSTASIGEARRQRLPDYFPPVARVSAKARQGDWYQIAKVSVIPRP
jgi:hypothetical protein